MAGRRLSAVVVAATYSVTHYVLVAGDLFKDFRQITISLPLLILFRVCLIFSIIIVIGHILPAFIRFNIRVSAALLKLINWMGRAADGGLELCRHGAIVTAENLIGWLHSLDAGGEATALKDAPTPPE
jgi:hypothetical protein